MTSLRVLPLLGRLALVAFMSSPEEAGFGVGVPAEDRLSGLTIHSFIWSLTCFDFALCGLLHDPLSPI